MNRQSVRSTRPILWTISLSSNIIKAEKFHWTRCMENVDNSVNLMAANAELFALIKERQLVM